MVIRMRWLSCACGLTALLLAAAPAAAQLRQTQPEGGSGMTAKELVVARKHMIVTAHPAASDAGRAILRAGGSAVDAAIAAQLVLNLVEPQSSGIGGGAFLVHWDAATQAVKTYDARERAPLSAREDRLLADGEPLYGYQAPTGYPDTAEDWVNTGALLERLNYSIALSSNQIAGTRVDLKQFAAKDRTSVLDKAVSLVLGGELSAGTRATLLKQMEQPLPDVKAPSEVNDDLNVPNMREGQAGGQNRQARLLKPSGDPEVFKVVSLVLGTPEFQRQ